ncbi:MAG: CocE/NonD family hydrolase [Thermoplasmatota archaeon]
MRSTILLVAAVAAVVAIPSFAFPAHAADAVSITTGVLTSFDGTPIVYTLFLPAGASATNPVPAVLMTHGWAGSRTTTATGDVGLLLDAGYAVLTWDSRGFGQSGGFIELDSPQYEVRDASGLVDVLAANPAIVQDHPGDPRVGMLGGSYAGGIQLLTASFDPRIDVIEPDITWNDLRSSLGPGGVVKEAWVDVLFGSGAATGTAYGLEPGNPAGPQAMSYDSNLPLWFAEAHAINGYTYDVYEGLRERSPSQFEAAIRAPTLLTQGLPDTLFNTNEAVANYKALTANGVPTKMVLYCGGHAGCPYSSDSDHLNATRLAWFAHYLKGDATVDTGANVEWFANDGVWRTSSGWPLDGTNYIHASGAGDVKSTPAPTGGGAYNIGAGGLNGGLSDPIQDNGVGSFLVSVATADASGLKVAGIGKAHLDVSGVGNEAFLFLRLVDMTDGTVLDGQTQAVRLPVSLGATTHVDADLVGVGYVLPPGHTLGVQVATSDIAHATNRVPGDYNVHVTVDVPVVS